MLQHFWTVDYNRNSEGIPRFLEHNDQAFLRLQLGSISSGSASITQSMIIYKLAKKCQRKLLFISTRYTLHRQKLITNTQQCVHNQHMLPLDGSAVFNR